MRKLLLPFFLLALFVPMVGCGGASDVDVEGNKEAETLEEDSNYEEEMMGGGDSKD